MGIFSNCERKFAHRFTSSLALLLLRQSWSLYFSSLLRLGVAVVVSVGRGGAGRGGAINDGIIFGLAQLEGSVVMFGGDISHLQVPTPLCDPLAARGGHRDAGSVG